MSILRVALVIASSVIALVLTACAQGSNQSRGAAASEEILAVHISASGVITANGQVGTLEELKPQFARLAAEGGAVLYTRDNPTSDPHPNAMKVIQALADSGVRILMPEK